MCKEKDVELQLRYSEKDIIPTSIGMTVSFFSINIIDSLAERQANFKIVHI